MSFRPLVSSYHVAISIEFSNSKGDAPLYCSAYEFSCADCSGFCYHLKNVPWVNIFKLGGFTATAGAADAPAAADNDDDVDDDDDDDDDEDDELCE